MNWLSPDGSCHPLAGGRKVHFICITHIHYIHTYTVCHKASRALVTIVMCVSNGE